MPNSLRAKLNQTGQTIALPGQNSIICSDQKHWEMYGKYSRQPILPVTYIYIPDSNDGHLNVAKNDQWSSDNCQPNKASTGRYIIHNSTYVTTTGLGAEVMKMIV